MSQLESIFSDIANSIRAKTGEVGGINPMNMSANIDNMPDGPDTVFINSTQYNNFTTNKANYLKTVFNSPISFDNNITSYSNAFNGLPSYNQPITIPYGVTNCYCMLYGCTSYNQPITIPDTVINCYYMFSGCNNFNQPVTIGNNVTNCIGMFSGCVNFNQPITISEKMINCLGMFSYCTRFNSDLYIYANNNITFNYLNMPQNTYTGENTNIVIGDNVASCADMFSGYYNNGNNSRYYNLFNAKVIIGNNVTNCFNMFYKCNNFNQPIIIPENVINCSNMFCGCSNFNQPITIPNNVKSFYGMFNGCINLNQTIDTFHFFNINVGLNRTFYACSNLQFTNTNNTIINTPYINEGFRYCEKLNTIIINTSTASGNFNYAFSECNNLKSVYIFAQDGYINYSNAYNSSYVANVLKRKYVAMFQNCASKIHIYTNSNDIKRIFLTGNVSTYGTSYQGVSIAHNILGTQYNANAAIISWTQVNTNYFTSSKFILEYNSFLTPSDVLGQI